MILLRLVQNELIKCFKKKSALFIFLFIFAGSALLTIINAKTYGAEWKKSLENENRSINELINKAENLSKRTKGYYQDIIICNEYRIQHDLRPSAAIDNINYTMNLNVFLQFLIVILVSNLVASEYATKNIRQYVSYPISKIKLSASKYIACVIAMAAFTVILLLSSIMVTGVKYGFDSLSGFVIAIKNGSITAIPLWRHLFISYSTFLPEYIFTMTLTFSIAIFTRNITLSTGIPIFLSFLGTIVADVLSNYRWGVLWPYIHTNMNQFKTGTLYYSYLSIEKSLGILAIYIAILYAAGTATFKKRDVLD